MKQLINFTLLLFVCTASVQAGATYFVTPNGSGDGSSWQQATDLVTATTLARSGDQVWVAGGTYLPTSSADRSATFSLPANVSFYGGFNGGEMSLDQRTPGNMPSILSGDIGQQGLASDNSYTVVYMEDGNGIRLDGFIITNGVARDYSEALQPSTCGGGLYVNGGQPMIVDCHFSANQARNGAAVFINGYGKVANPVFQNSTFTNNQADFKGGAVYNNGENGIASPRFQYCAFEANKSDYGGALFNNGTEGESAPLVINCNFTNNYSLSTGAVVFNFLRGDRGTVNPILKDCELIGNDSVLGSDIAQNRHTAALEGAVVPTGGTRSPNPANR